MIERFPIGALRGVFVVALLSFVLGLATPALATTPAVKPWRTTVATMTE